MGKRAVAAADHRRVGACECRRVEAVVGGGGAYRLAVFSSDAVNRVSGSMDCSHHTGDVTRSGGQVCWIADVAGMGAGWRPVLVTVGEPSDPQDPSPRTQRLPE
jgi:hypothetical protein